jgi:hypothetical protein
MVKGAPADYATNPKYMEGFGHWRPGAAVNTGPLVAYFCANEGRHDWSNNSRISPRHCSLANRY